jgi:hypothetical protein
LRNRYGYKLPDDDAGREDLYELLLNVSLGDGADRKMRNAIATWAPWMSGEEASGLIDLINRTPDHQRKRDQYELGQIWGLTWKQRQDWGIRTVAPSDLTKEEFQQARKDRKAWMQWKRRHDCGKLTRAQWLEANSLSRTEPWKAEKMSRGKWYRLRSKPLAETGLKLEQAIAQ